MDLADEAEIYLEGYASGLEHGKKDRLSQIGPPGLPWCAQSLVMANNQMLMEIERLRSELRKAEA